MSLLAGKTAFITGGGSGIGLGCAEAFVRDGANVLIMGRSEDKLKDACRKLGEVADGADSKGMAIDYYAGSVADELDVERAVGHAVKLSGTGPSRSNGLHLVVANAGTGALSPVVATNDADLKAVFETNFYGTFYTFKHGGAALSASGGGAMCAISSIAGVRTHRFMSVYCATKAAVDDLVRNTADELGVAGVRVNSVAPGLVDTDIAQGLFTTDAVHKDYLDCMPIQRTGQVVDIANAVRFLCGPESSWVTGVTLSVDGGHHLRRGPNVQPIAEMMFPASVLAGQAPEG